MMHAGNYSITAIAILWRPLKVDCGGNPKAIEKELLRLTEG